MAVITLAEKDWQGKPFTQSFSVRIGPPESRWANARWLHQNPRCGQRGSSLFCFLR